MIPHQLGDGGPLSGPDAETPGQASSASTRAMSSCNVPFLSLAPSTSAAHNLPGIATGGANQRGGAVGVAVA
jgi:hypothetical protein